MNPSLALEKTLGFGVELKKCKRCKQRKILDNFRSFFVKKVKRHYFRSYCKQCLNKITNIRRRKNPKLKKKENKRRLDYYYRNKTRINKARSLRRKLGRPQRAVPNN